MKKNQRLSEKNKIELKREENRAKELDSQALMTQFMMKAMESMRKEFWELWLEQKCSVKFVLQQLAYL